MIHSMIAMHERLAGQYAQCSTMRRELHASLLDLGDDGMNVA
jgi:hypothetical protein